MTDLLITRLDDIKDFLALLSMVSFILSFLSLLMCLFDMEIEELKFVKKNRLRWFASLLALSVLLAAVDTLTPTREEALRLTGGAEQKQGE
ncbi:MAG: hypothetical protein J6Y62_04515 [Clostridia bacterium]|nr:hypothetical protein [Clostridia bacterium]